MQHIVSWCGLNKLRSIRNDTGRTTSANVNNHPKQIHQMTAQTPPRFSSHETVKRSQLLLILHILWNCNLRYFDFMFVSYLVAIENYMFCNDMKVHGVFMIFWQLICKQVIWVIFWKTCNSKISTSFNTSRIRDWSFEIQSTTTTYKLGGGGKCSFHLDWATQAFDM